MLRCLESVFRHRPNAKLKLMVKADHENVHQVMLPLTESGYDVEIIKHDLR